MEIDQMMRIVAGVAAALLISGVAQAATTMQVCKPIRQAPTPAASGLRGIGTPAPDYYALCSRPGYTCTPVTTGFTAPGTRCFTITAAHGAQLPQLPRVPQRQADAGPKFPQLVPLHPAGN